MPLATIPDAPPRRPRRWRPLLTLLPLVLLMHALLLGLLPVGVGPGTKGDVHRALQVRQIALPAPPPSAELAVPPAPEPPRPAPLAVPTPAVVARTAAAAASTAEPAGSAPALAAAPPAPEAGGQTVPVYATKMPAAVRLSYELRRGSLGGDGELVWQPHDGGYELTMEGSAFAINLIAWSSQGRLDLDGIAPERFTDHRRGRPAQAANFQRDKGLISCSGPAVEYPLVAGAQDRLSWMLQLPAIVAAEPGRYAVGEHITMFVAGARGEADLWTFSVEAVETVEVPAGAVAGALRLRRAPRRPYDTQVDVWLDPARSWLVVRARLSTSGTDDSTEFLLRQMTLL